MIRKFFDPAVADSPAIALPAASEQPMSIAAMLAKHGVTNNGEEMVATPISITPEKKEEPAKVDEPTPAATANEASKTEPASPESPKPSDEPAPTPLAQKEPEPVKVQTWQEVLKQQPDTKVILKELGFDDSLVSFVNELKSVDPKMVAFFNRWKSGEDLATNLRELTTDYSKMTAEDVMRHQLQQDYPKASKQQLDILYRSKVVNAYKLDSDDETEKTDGQLLLEAEADKYRDSLAQNQQKYLFPKAPEPKAAEPDIQAERAKQRFEVIKSQISDNPVTKNIIATKQFSLGEGEEKFSFPVDPSVLLGTMFDQNRWNETQFEFERNGEEVTKVTPKTEHLLLTNMVAIYGKQFMDEYAKHYRSIGGKSAIKPIENAKENDTGSPSKSEVAQANAAAAMAKSGTLNSGGYNR